MRRLHSALFPLLWLTVVGLLLWLAERHPLHSDWTAQARHSLDPASIAVLARLEGPLEITLFLRQGRIAEREAARELVARYQRHTPHMTLHLLDPLREPELARRFELRGEGEALIAYQGRQERLPRLAEEPLTNAIARLLRSGARQVLILESPDAPRTRGGTTTDLDQWTDELERRGLTVAPFDPLHHAGALPEAVALVVLPAPRRPLPTATVTALRDYVARGGHLLWLHEPGPLHGLEPIADDLGITPSLQPVDDPAVRLLGLPLEEAVLVDRHGNHPVTTGLDQATLLPRSAALDLSPDSPWQVTPLQFSGPRSRLEGAFEGPFILGVALERPMEAGPPQRLAVLGGGALVSNGWLYNQGNLAFALRLTDWLLRDDSLITIPPLRHRDLTLQMSERGWLLFGLIHLLLLPLLLFAVGGWIHYRRRRR